MKIFEPVNITSTRLLSSNVPEDEGAEWVVGTTYAKDVVVKVSTYDGVDYHKAYKSLADGNVGNPPPTTSTGLTPKWSEVGWLNRWKCVDPYVNTQTENTGTIEVMLNSSGCDSLAMFNLIGTSVKYTVYDNTDTIVVPETTVLLDRSGVVDWLTYFLNPFDYRNDFIVYFPFYYTSKIKVVLDGQSGTAKIGQLVTGKSVDIGLTKYDIEMAIIDYSRKVTDEFGRTTLSQGKWAKKVSAEMHITNDRFDYLYKYFSRLRAVPCVFDFNNDDMSDFESLIIYGIYKDFAQIIPYPQDSECKLEIEGLI